MHLDGYGLSGMVHEWEENCIDYEGLKRILQEIISSNQESEKNPHEKLLGHTLSLERAFHGLHHLQHRNNHATIDEEDLLNKQMENLIALRAKMKNPDIGTDEKSIYLANFFYHAHGRKDMDSTNREDPLEVLGPSKD